MTRNYIVIRANGDTAVLPGNKELALAEFQKLLDGGYLEHDYMDPETANQGISVMVDEDGLQKQLPRNPVLVKYVGPVIVGSMEPAPDPEDGQLFLGLTPDQAVYFATHTLTRALDQTAAPGHRVCGFCFQDFPPDCGSNLKTDTLAPFWTCGVCGARFMNTIRGLDPATEPTQPGVREVWERATKYNAARKD